MQFEFLLRVDSKKQFQLECLWRNVKLSVILSKGKNGNEFWTLAVAHDSVWQKNG